MPVTRCACPSCNRQFSVPDDIVGKRAKCPGCDAPLDVRAMGGKTILRLAGVSGTAKTALAPTVATRQAPAVVEVKARPVLWRLLWLGGGALLVVMCCGGAGIVGVVWWKYSAVAVNRTETTRREAKAAERKPVAGKPAVEKPVDLPVQREAIRPVAVAPPRAKPEEGNPPPALQKTKLETLFGADECAAMRVEAEKDFWAVLHHERGTQNTLEIEPTKSLQRLCQFRDGYKPLIAALDEIPENPDEYIRTKEQRMNYDHARLIMQALRSPRMIYSEADPAISFRQYIPPRLLMRYARLLVVSQNDISFVCGFLIEQGERAKEAIPLLKKQYLKANRSDRKRLLEETIKKIQAQ